LQGALHDEWSYFIKGLQQCGIFLDDAEDSLAWTWNDSSGDVTTKLAYIILSFSLLLKIILNGGSNIYGSGIAH